MMENKVDSVLFDLDGTLWDAVPVIFRVIQDLFREYSSVPAADTTLDDVYAYMGLQTWDIMKLCFPRSGRRYSAADYGRLLFQTASVSETRRCCVI